MRVSSLSSLTGSAASSRRSWARSACSASRCELTETNSPTAIDIAPATSAATPAVSTVARDASAAATPTIRLAVETIPSLAPSTAARNQPTRLACGGAQGGAPDLSNPCSYGQSSGPSLVNLVPAASPPPHVVGAVAVAGRPCG